MIAHMNKEWTAMRSFAALFCASILGLAVYFSAVVCSSAVTRIQLITDKEARLPDDWRAIQIATRNLTRAPTVNVLLPDQSQSQPSPLHLKLKFTAHNGSDVDLSSARFTYLKIPPVDLTERVKPYLTPQGLDIDAAEVPPGLHLIRVELRDTQGRTSSTIIKLEVVPK
jgi:hypothetical protein